MTSASILITPQNNAEETLQRLFVAEQRHARELAALNTAFRAMSSSLELRSVLRVVTRELQHLIGSESVSVLLRDGDELVFAAATGPGSEQLIGTRMPAAAGVAGAVLRSQIPSVITNAPADTHFFSAIDAQTGLTTQTILAVPLVLAEVAIGVMEAINKTPEPFGTHDLDLMVAIAGSAAIAIENARLFEAQREHNRQLQAAQPQLIQTEKMAALGRLTASMAHEINNPLQVVQGCLTLIDETLAETQFDGQVRATLQRDLMMAVTEVDRMAMLVRRLRDFYQLAPVPAPLTTTQLTPIIGTVLEITAQQLASQQIRVEWHVAWSLAAEMQESANEPHVAADPDRVKQVLLYLVLNAIDAMPNGGWLHIDLGLDECGGHNGAPARPCVRIAIGDTGPLIPAPLLARTFEPFYTARATQSSFGLTICYEFVTSLGGEISVTSEAAEGTVFTVWLPIAPAAD
jgi:two-component system, NtrC family, sensor kinase